MEVHRVAPRFFAGPTLPGRVYPARVERAASRREAAFIPSLPEPTPPAEPITPSLPVPVDLEHHDTTGFDRTALWERVVATQFALRVGSKTQKSLAVGTTAVTFASVGAIAALAVVSTQGAAAVAIPVLGACNFVLGCLSMHAAVATFRHNQPARPAALRRHSFYLSGIVPTRRQARKIVAWLVEQGFVGEGRCRPVRVEADAATLVQRGITERFADLNRTQVEQIAETLTIVLACQAFAGQTPHAQEVAAAPLPAARQGHPGDTPYLSALRPPQIAWRSGAASTALGSLAAAD